MAKFHCLPLCVLMVAAVLQVAPHAAFAQNQTAAPRAAARPPANLTQAAAVTLQRNLRYLGYDPGPIDGVVGPATRRAQQRLFDDAGVGVPSNPVMASLWIQRATEVARARGDNPVMALRFLRTEASVAGNGLELRGRPARTNSLAAGVAASVAAPSAARIASGTTRSAAAAPAASQSAPVATREFAGPDQYPPEGYRGYGVVAFKSLSTAFDRERHNIICEAYSAALIPDSQQITRTVDKFVTIWPVESAATAQALNAAPMSARGELCDRAIRSYNIQLANDAIRAARAAGFDDTGRGPFFLGWVPAHTYGAQDALVIVMDLSTVESYPQAEALVGEWKLDIQSDPALLSQPLNPEMMRRKLRRWSDKYGFAFLSLVRGE